MHQAMELRVLCWTEELAGKAESDIRLCIGAFENGKMLGVAFGSLAEPSDIPEKGIELNGLWIYPDQRGKGIFLMLIIRILDFYLKKGMKQIVVYSHHYAPSSQFYRRFGAQVARQEYQMDDRLLVAVKKIEQSLGYPSLNYARRNK